ncbi:MAG TPA: diadenylate cyclase CdaA [Patescibacteria group bacterium]|nr:diadenylate cyclase CdaA [Patescibacteria group bacterium]
MIDLFRLGFIDFTLIDLIDIMIVAFVFYWLYRALRNTIAIQILFGLVLMLFLSFGTNLVNLKSVSWIMNAISGIWGIAFIILFQPEIRRMLLLLTRNPIFRIFLKENIGETLDDIVEACADMAEKHVGALIVFTRTQNVKITIDTGIPIQAVVSKEILMSIFNPRSPLHDGAVVIEGQTVVAARCVLQLSNVTKHGNRNLGTRHRAGLGISENADVVVLIVSEETGSISIAHEGVLTMNIPVGDLKGILQRKLSFQELAAAV